MSRKLLLDSNIHSKALGQMEHFHEAVVLEVISSIAENKIVVIGMKQNPVVKRARNFLESKQLEYTYLEYGSYLKGWKKRLAIKLWSGWPTYPQVFIDGKLVGGCRELELHIK